MAKELKRVPFIKRFSAYIIDYLLVLVIVSLLSSPFVDTKKAEKLEKETIEIMEKYQSSDISSKEYLERYSDVYYKLSRNNGIISFVEIIICILYFVVFQLYNKGQTIGKKLMKIKVISDGDGLSMNQMIFRVLISNMLLLNIINFGFMIFSPKGIYMGVTLALSMIQYIIVFISVIMALSNEGRTIHDRIAHTRVINID